jgi:uncharacterized damage-inducible protein DinB
MTTAEREQLIRDLQESRQVLLDTLAGIPQERAAAKPADGWSILGCVEHVATAERGMLAMISRATEPAPPGDRAASEARIAEIASNRERKLPAPEAAHPTGRYETLELALSRFVEARDRTIAYIEKCEDDLRGRMVQHPVGAITARECLVLMIQHPIRHAAQIREILAQAATA